AQKKYIQDSYYQLAFKRNSIMVENTVRKAKENGQRIVVLIAGGFHTPGITRILRQQGLPYLVIRPNLSGAETAPGENVQLKKAGRERFQAFVKEYVQRLEKMRGELPENPGSDGDRELKRQLERVIDAFKNRLAFAGPMERAGKTYILGAYQ